MPTKVLCKEQVPSRYTLLGLSYHQCPNKAVTEAGYCHVHDLTSKMTRQEQRWREHCLGWLDNCDEPVIGVDSTGHGYCFEHDPVKLTEEYLGKESWRDLLSACKIALDHVEELRDAWERGVIRESDGKGGTRSNRNVEVERLLQTAIKKSTQVSV